MTLVESNGSMIVGETSSEPISSNNQTPKPLSPEPQLDTKQVSDSVASISKLNEISPGKKIIKKKIVVRRKIVKKKKEDVQNVNGGDMKQKNVLSGEPSNINHENLNKDIVSGSKKVAESDDKVDSQNVCKEVLKQDVMDGEQRGNDPGNLKKRKKVLVRKKIQESNGRDGSHAVNTEELKRNNIKTVVDNKKSLENIEIEVQIYEKNRDHFGGTENEWRKQNIEDGDGFSNKQHNLKSKEKSSGLVENVQTSKKEGKDHQKKTKKVGGVILFCSSKTRSDCFRYHVMGVAPNKKDLVLSMEPGLKLFLFDFDVKLLYGIYKASSPGGTKLEPAAFNGCFPFQVRFEIYQDCHPLPESVFKTAIKENYDGNDKFDQELTFQQVNKLIELFKSAKEKQHAPLFYPPRTVSVHRVEAQHVPLTYPPQAMSMKRVDARERETDHMPPHHSQISARELYTYNESKRCDLHLDGNDEHLADVHSPSVQRETSPEYFFLSEKDYRTYGLRRVRRKVTPPISHITPSLELESRDQERHYMRPDSKYRDAEKQHPTSYSQFARQERGSSGHQITPNKASMQDLDYHTYGLRREIKDVTPPKICISPTLELDCRDQEHRRYIHPGRAYIDTEKHYATSYSHLARQEQGSSGPHVRTSTASTVDSDYQFHSHRMERRDIAPPEGRISPTMELDSRDQERRYLRRDRKYRHDEKEYPTSYSHFDRQEVGSSRPHLSESTASIVDSYLTVPYYGSAKNLYKSPSRREKEEAALGSSSLGRMGTSYPSEASYFPRREIHPSQGKHYRAEASSGKRENYNLGSLYSSYASNALSEYNQLRTNGRNRHETSQEKVSARYSFGGSSRQYP